MYKRFVPFLASSKQRARLRHSVSLDKLSIAKLGRQYNIIASQLQTPPPQLTDEDLENGTFPWSELSGTICLLHVFNSKSLFFHFII